MEVTQADRDAAHDFNLYVTGASLRDTEETELAEAFAKIRITAEKASTIEAIQKMLERGKATLDSDGYLVLIERS